MGVATLESEDGFRMINKPPASVSRLDACRSVTRQEIANFWKQKLIDEEDHLIDAIKAAARIRARHLTETDYKHFEESLKDDGDGMARSGRIISRSENNNTATRLGIKDWWKRSSHAYLNQSSLESPDPQKLKTSSYYSASCLFFNPILRHPSSMGRVS